MLPCKNAAVAALLFSAVLHTSAFAADWLGGSGIFSDPAQWSPSLPGPADPANFPTGGNVIITTNPSTLSLSIPAASTSLFLMSPGTNLPPLEHIYSLLGSAPNTLEVSNASLSLSGGSLTLPNGGIALSNATATLNNSSLINYATTAVANNSSLFINNTSALATENLVIGATGSGTVTLSSPSLQNSARISSTTISLSSSTPNAVAQLDVKNGSVTNSGTIFVGGTAAGPQGNGNLQVLSYQNNFPGGSVSTDSLVVYDHGTILTNFCSNIMTRFTSIAGNAQLLSTIGSGGGLSASQSVNLLPGSSTYLETSIISPSVTLASGALLTSAGGRIQGTLKNAGELHSAGLHIVGLPGTSVYSQSSTGVLAGTLSATPLLDLHESSGVLAGTLRLDIPDTLTLVPGEAFPIIHASTLFGNFSSIELLGNNPDQLTASFDPATGLLIFPSAATTGANTNLPEPLSLALLPAALLALSLRLHLRHHHT